MPKGKNRLRYETRKRLEFAVLRLASRLEGGELPSHRTGFFREKLARMRFQLKRLENLTARVGAA